VISWFQTLHFQTIQLTSCEPSRYIEADVAARWGLTLETLCTVKGAALEGLTYTHPMYGRESPVVGLCTLESN
jgi:hypothetical protein